MNIYLLITYFVVSSNVVFKESTDLDNNLTFLLFFGVNPAAALIGERNGLFTNLLFLNGVFLLLEVNLLSILSLFIKKNNNLSNLRFN